MQLLPRGKKSLTKSVVTARLRFTSPRWACDLNYSWIGGLSRPSKLNLYTSGLNSRESY
jgi:hypothetical protein